MDTNDAEPGDDAGFCPPSGDAAGSFPSGKDDINFNLPDHGDDDPDFTPPDNRNEEDLTAFIKEALKHNVSTRAMSDLFNSCLVVLGVKDPSKFVSHTKMWSHRLKYINSLPQIHKNNTG